MSMSRQLGWGLNIVVIVMTALIVSGCGLFTVVEAFPDEGGEPRNLLSYPGFEPEGEGLMPKGWAIVSGVMDQDFELVPNMGLTGGWAYRLFRGEEQSRSTRIHTLPVQITPGKTYEGSVWIRVVEGSGRMYLQYFDVNGNRLMTPSDSEPKRDHGNWVRLSVTEVAPENAVYARVSIDSSSQVTDVYFDGAELVEVVGD